MKDRSDYCLEWQQRLTKKERDAIFARPLGHGLGYIDLVKALSQGAGRGRPDAEKVIVFAIETYAHADLLFAELEKQFGLQPDASHKQYLMLAYHCFLANRAGMREPDEPEKVRVDVRAPGLTGSETAGPDGLVPCILIGETGTGDLELLYQSRGQAHRFAAEPRYVSRTIEGPWVARVTRNLGSDKDRGPLRGSEPALGVDPSKKRITRRRWPNFGADLTIS